MSCLQPGEIVYSRPSETVYSAAHTISPNFPLFVRPHLPHFFLCGPPLDPILLPTRQPPTCLFLSLFLSFVLVPSPTLFLFCCEVCGIQISSSIGWSPISRFLILCDLSPWRRGLHSAVLRLFFFPRFVISYVVCADCPFFAVFRNCF